MGNPTPLNSAQMAKFKPVPQQGLLDYAPNNSYSVRVATAQTDNLIPGSAVKVVDSTMGITEVIAAAPTDKIKGFVPYEIVKNVYHAGDVLTLALRGSIIWLAAEAAFNAGTVLEYDNVTDGTKVQVKTWGGVNTPIGTALTKATAPGDLVKVELDQLGISPYVVPSS